MEVIQIPVVRRYASVQSSPRWSSDETRSKKKAMWVMKIINEQEALGTDFSGYVVLPAVGTSRWVLVTWRQHIQLTGNNHVDNNNVLVKFHSDNGLDWWLTSVYGPQGNEEKITFLQELREVRGPAQHCGCAYRRF
jgi:hypothetical protein